MLLSTFQRYTTMKYLSVILISLGIATCTVMSGLSVSSTNKNNEAKVLVGGEEQSKDDAIAEDTMHFVYWMIGIGMLTFALFMSARMGIYQEVIYAKYGKHSKEALFYCVSEIMELVDLS
jgi:UDP-xylose/UDP-N-acetylglucosamine transporter B4